MFEFLIKYTNFTPTLILSVIGIAVSIILATLNNKNKCSYIKLFVAIMLIIITFIFPKWDNIIKEYIENDSIKESETTTEIENLKCQFVTDIDIKEQYNEKGQLLNGTIGYLNEHDTGTFIKYNYDTHSFESYSNLKVTTDYNKIRLKFFNINGEKIAEENPEDFSTFHSLWIVSQDDYYDLDGLVNSKVRNLFFMYYDTYIYCQTGVYQFYVYYNGKKYISDIYFFDCDAELDIILKELN